MRARIPDPAPVIMDSRDGELVGRPFADYLPATTPEHLGAWRALGDARQLNARETHDRFVVVAMPLWLLAVRPVPVLDCG